MTTAMDEVQTVDQQIAERVLVAMFRARMKHSELAAAAGIGKSSWTLRMQGARPWRAEEVVRVAAALKVSPAELLPHLDSNQEPAD